MAEYTNAIEIDGLTKKYDGFTLDNISFNVPKGTIMGFIGQNGAGKTTKDYAAKGMAKVLTCKSELEESIQDIKDNAEDIHTDAKAAKKEAVCVDVTAEDE